MHVIDRLISYFNSFTSFGESLLDRKTHTDYRNFYDCFSYSHFSKASLLVSYVKQNYVNHLPVLSKPFIV